MTERPRTGVDALARELREMKRDIELLKNDPHRTGSGIVMALSGAQFNPQSLGTVNGTVPDRGDELDDTFTTLALSPVTWSTVATAYDIGFDGSRVQLNSDGLWLLVHTVTPHYEEYGPKGVSVVTPGIIDGGNLAGHIPTADTALTNISAVSTPGGPHYAQTIGYGNSFSLGVFAGAVVDSTPHLVLPSHFVVKTEIHRLIEG